MFFPLLFQRCFDGYSFNQYFTLTVSMYPFLSNNWKEPFAVVKSLDLSRSKREITESLRASPLLLKRGMEPWDLNWSRMVLNSCHHSVSLELRKEKIWLKWKYLLKVERLHCRSYSLSSLPPLKKHFVVPLPAANRACEVYCSFELYTHASSSFTIVCALTSINGLHLGHMSKWLAINRQSREPLMQQRNSAAPVAALFIRTSTSPCISLGEAYEVQAVFNLSVREQLGHLLYTLPAAEPGNTCQCSRAPGAWRWLVEGYVGNVLDLTLH